MQGFAIALDDIVVIDRYGSHTDLIGRGRLLYDPVHSSRTAYRHGLIDKQVY